MDERTLKRLEYDKILEQLAGCALSALGRERALALRPVSDRELITLWQDQTSEGRNLLRLEPNAALGGWEDIRRPLARARRGAVLEPEELFAVGQTVRASRLVKNFFAERPGKYPLLEKIAVALANFNEMEHAIAAAILPGGEIADQASPELAQIRRRLIRGQQQIKERLGNVIRSPSYQKYLQDPIVTIREGRYVVPVKQEYRAQVPGIIHDQSASGATLFIEPMAVLEANNEVRRLQAAEKQEIARILTELSGMVARQGEELAASLATLGELDLILARARYSQRLDAWAPVILPAAAVLDIRRGRHPLLSGEVVPVSVHLGRSFDTLVITGPNTGGKTVTLKTIGLLILMAQSGLHLPAGEGTAVGVFRQVFADIGDEQSIEQSLSTFSSHLKNIVYILQQAGPDSLVLLDELGAGTDPAEGAALAQAILEALHAAGAKTVATTHYSELKNFAYTRERVENASVEFDAVTLRPTYRLLIGKPGRSNAFEIAARLGLSANLVARAKQFQTTEQVEVGELLDRLEKEQQLAGKERLEAERMRREAESLREHCRQIERDLSEKRDTVLMRARDEARTLVTQARREAEETIRELRARLSADTAREREAAIREARERLGVMQGRVQANVSRTPDGPGKVPQTVNPGQEVFLPRFNQHGFVAARPENGTVQVQVGVIKLNVSLQDLRLVEEEHFPSGRVQVAALIKSKSQEVSTRLDLRGMRAEEALLEVEKYLDDATLAGLPRVQLVHGKGTGALRAAVQQQLKGDRRVKSFRLGEQGEGGMGVTVVELA
ncbi:endonuclease MutS2 [Desulfotomaculum copahuensis]|uniref:Endonuclease MutS2 n=1 Tax=Desulfotomaculum copahuensis TaxID=1838280 RepID=A0A1B7LAY7_9FIRM|nr:endonuclease MutS2 [Desulfotomaculum copahuensis]OAT79381.1 endonuclease MutS2 [Desulfotomaculum copahuensis]